MESKVERKLSQRDYEILAHDIRSTGVLEVPSGKYFVELSEYWEMMNRYNRTFGD